MEKDFDEKRTSPTPDVDRDVDMHDDGAPSAVASAGDGHGATHEAPAHPAKMGKKQVAIIIVALCVRFSQRKQ